MARKWEKLRKKSEIFRFAHINHGSQIPIFGSDSKFDTREHRQKFSPIFGHLTGGGFAPGH